MAESAVDRSVYEELDLYPWEEDTEFQGGLTAILGNDPPPEQASELTLRARCFYYQRLVDSLGEQTPLLIGSSGNSTSP